MRGCLSNERAVAGVELTPKDEILTAEEIIRVARLFVSHGVNKIRLTGGEPTVRPDIIEIMQVLCQLWRS